MSKRQSAQAAAAPVARRLPPFISTRIGEAERAVCAALSRSPAASG